MNGPYHDGYANLAAAIVKSGIECNDTRFLKSDWCDTLKDICRLDYEMHGGKNTNTHVSLAKLDIKEDM